MTLTRQVSRAWENRPAGERRRLLFGLGIGLVLAGYLLVQRVDIPAWTTIAPSSVTPNTRLLGALPMVTAMDSDAWRQGALRYGIVLETAQADASGWQLAGRLDEAAAFETFSAWAARRGWWATAWTLARDDGTGLTLEARFDAQLEHLALERGSREDAP